MEGSCTKDFCDMDSGSEFWLPEKGFSSLFSTPAVRLPVGTLLLLLCIYFVGKGIFCFINHFLTVSVQVINNTRTNLELCYYESLLKWLGKNVHLQIGRTVVSSKTIEERTNSFAEPNLEEDEDSEVEDDSKDWEYQLNKTVGYGTNYFLYQGKWIKIKREVSPQEMLTFTLYRWDKALVDEILDKAKPKPYKTDKKNTIVIYTAENYRWNRLGGPKRKRPLNSLILDQKMLQILITDIRNFLGREDWYVERGIPYRRGYLIYGPPGCGKSSIIKAIAGEIGYDICVFSLSQKLTDDSMNSMLNQAPQKSIILLEDIDAAFKSREDGGATSKETNLAFEGCSQSSLTFRGLLNALDGVGSAEHGQLVFMSTNYPERLDPALVRPGRVDLKVFIDYPNDFQLEGMFKRFHPDAGEEMTRKFVEVVRGLDVKVSMAMIQGLMVIYADDPQGAIDNVKEHFQSQFADVSFQK